MHNRLLESEFFQLLLAHPVLTYAVVFVVVLVEGGDAALFTAMILVQRGILDLYITIPIVLVAVITGDIGWYYLGPYLGRWPVIRHILALASAFDHFIKKHPTKAMVISKFCYGLHRPIQMRLQKLGMRFPEYIKYETLSSVIWIAVIGVLSYTVLASVFAFQRSFRFVEIGLGVGFLLFFILTRGITTYAESVMTDVEEEKKKNRQKRDS